MGLNEHGAGLHLLELRQSVTCTEMLLLLPHAYILSGSKLSSQSVKLHKYGLNKTAFNFIVNVGGVSDKL